MPRPKTPDPGTPPLRFSLIYILVGLWALIFIRDFLDYKKRVEPIAYSDFVADVRAGRVSEANIGTERIEGTFKPAPDAKGAQDAAKDAKPREFVTTKVDDPTLPGTLEAHGVKFSGMHESTFLRDLLSWVVPAMVLGLIWLWILRNAGGQAGRGGGILAFGKSKAKIYVEKGLKTRFEDVAGADEAKEELREIVDFLRDPTSYSRLGGRMPKGVLLVGPPGTGKTLISRAVAGEAGVPFFSINGSEFVELFVGLGAARVRDLFQQARAQAPCILFIDELDAIGKARGISAITGGGNDEKEQTLNQLLAEMDGFDPTTGVILLGATNRPEVLDPALLRAGRFDRQVVMDKPDRKGREKILEINLGHVKAAPSVSAQALAGMTAGFSGADLANLVNEAALIATRRGKAAVEASDCTEAIERGIAGLERRSRVIGPNEKRRVAYHEMGHATLALSLGEGETVHKVSVIPRGVSALGYTLRRPTEDRYLMSRHELEDRLAIALGGRAAEVLFFDDISTGAADDLDQATDIARAMITRFGMSRELGLAVFERDANPMLGGQAVRNFGFSEHTAQRIDAEIERLLDGAEERALGILEKFRPLIEEGARILLTRETLNEEEIQALWKKHGEAAAQAA
jgi:cell division protease FtsH